MKTDEEVFEWVNRMIPPEVSRESAMSALNAGEAFVATVDLVDYAAGDNLLPRVVMECLKREYPHPSQRVFFEFYPTVD